MKNKNLLINGGGRSTKRNYVVFISLKPPNTTLKHKNLILDELICYHKKVIKTSLNVINNYSDTIKHYYVLTKTKTYNL